MNDPGFGRTFDRLEEQEEASRASRDEKRIDIPVSDIIRIIMKYIRKRKAEKQQKV